MGKDGAGIEGRTVAWSAVVLYHFSFSLRVGPFRTAVPKRQRAAALHAFHVPERRSPTQHCREPKLPGRNRRSTGLMPRSVLTRRLGGAQHGRWILEDRVADRGPGPPDLGRRRGIGRRRWLERCLGRGCHDRGKIGGNVRAGDDDGICRIFGGGVCRRCDGDRRDWISPWRIGFDAIGGGAQPFGGFARIFFRAASGEEKGGDGELGGEIALLGGFAIPDHGIGVIVGGDEIIGELGLGGDASGFGFGPQCVQVWLEILVLRRECGKGGSGNEQAGEPESTAEGVDLHLQATGSRSKFNSKAPGGWRTPG